ncbi:Emopamil-binding protein [Aaosphaeria arxii CBS 175.79]|uniref:Emopamil-binding protein n=1 Tax=Aaosphaeria arxii CBS 175.79 TaxID=1450172 RepID=A0A6A5XRT2_9PLEO|nr:Emopamil-binding protein [Aaosphaeria arxii CBS 175.79]KAF2015400.1 Emopamil-binding protein [Aaosphaeria arxii CBS 175.79]
MARGYFGSKPAAPPLPVPRQGPVIDATTIISLLGVLALLGGAYATSVKLLPKATTLKTRILFVWHLFDALIHLVFEGSFLYNCFFVSYSLPTSFSVTSRHHPHIRLLTPPDVYWLGREDQLYGANYGTGPFSRLWQEYAKADHRWGGVDLTVVTLEVLTVCIGAPLALWICELLRREERKGALKRWFWMIVLATAELYGGWMTFGPEWLTGSPNLDTSNWMYLWLYLAFFNGLWVVFPLWILWEAYRAMGSAMSQAEMVDLVNYLKKDS